MTGLTDKDTVYLNKHLQTKFTPHELNQVLIKAGLDYIIPNLNPNVPIEYIFDIINKLSERGHEALGRFLNTLLYHENLDTQAKHIISDIIAKYDLLRSPSVSPAVTLNTKPKSSEKGGDEAYVLGSIYGIPYSEWTARWWQWLLSIPLENNPAFDDTGKDCMKKQDGPVFFLAGTMEGKVDRECVIETDKSILLPIINVECSYIENPCLWTETELRESARFMIDQVSSKSVSLNGKSLDHLMGRVQSGLFEVTFPNNNIIGVHEGRTQAISDGYWIFLKPLPPGTHHVEFNAMASFSNGLTVRKEGVYRLIVEPSKMIPPVEKDSEGRIHFHPARMTEGLFYPFDHKGKHYLLTKSKNGIIDFYEIIGSVDSNE